MKAITICKRFYQDYLAELIHKEFPEYESKIAVGLVGEGSECFGFDDEFSKDHDFGYGVCLWLTDEDYWSIGPDLSVSYHKALAEFEVSMADDAVKNTVNSLELGTGISRYDRRRGVMRIGDFFQNLLGITFDLEEPALTNAQWFYIEEWKLAQAINGEIFRDDLGIISNIRNVLRGYYPEKIWLMRLVNGLHGFAACAQSNYPRCMARGDEVTASICKNQGLERAMEIVFLLKRSFSPYYKWTYRALLELADKENSQNSNNKNWIEKIAKLLQEISLTNAQTDAWRDYQYSSVSINKSDQIVRLFEEIAGLIVAELNKLALTDSENPFLEVHSQTLAQKISNL